MSGLSDSPLIPIKPEGSKPPLFLVHAVGGSIVPYFPLGRLVDADQPLYGLQHPGLDGGPLEGSIEALAARYVTAVRAVAPHGPYRLGGWSLGGLVAVEMSHQLRSAGEPTALVVMFDTDVPPVGGAEPAMDRAGLLGQFVRDLADLSGVAVPPVDVAAIRPWSPAAQDQAVLGLLESAGLIPPGIRDEMRHRIGLFEANTHALFAYRPRPAADRLVLFSAEQHPDRLAEQARAWRAVAGDGLEIHMLGGDHYSMVQPPHLAGLARRLQHCLDRAAPADVPRS